MRFTQVHLKNWRNFSQADLELQQRMFLVGPNASGKSNFLDVFRLLSDVVTQGGIEKAVMNRGGVSRLRCLAARQHPNIEIDVSLGDDKTEVWRYHLAFSQDRERPVIREEKVWGSGEVIITRPDKDDRADPERLRQTHLEQVNANRKFRPIAEFFSSIRYYHIVPQLVREPDRSAGRQADPYGGDFLERMARTAKGTRDARLKRILECLKVAVPQLQQLELTTDPRGLPHLRGKYEHWRSKGAWQNEVDFSDGTLRLLGLLWALLDGSGPVLLEEPELSLHAEVVRFIPQMMYKVQRKLGRQILVSTHSSDLLRDEGIAPDEVALFSPSSEGTEVKTGAAISEVRFLLQKGLSVAEAVFPRTRPRNADQLALFGD
ncbi:MAG: AAA family ATPase [Methanocella sp.]